MRDDQSMEVRTHPEQAACPSPEWEEHEIDQMLALLGLLVAKRHVQAGPQLDRGDTPTATG